MLNEYVDWRHMRIHVQVRGQGEPLLLLNGLGANTDMWEAFAAQFPDRRIVLFDAPGTGRSSESTFPMSISVLAELADNVLDFHGIRKTDVLGYSYGGAIAQQFAYEYGHRVRRLVLASTNCGVGATLGSLQAMFILATPFRYYSKAYFYRIAPSLYGGRTARDIKVRQRMMDSRSKYPPSSQGYTLQIMGGSTWTSRRFLHRLKTETLVISGDDDPLIPVSNAKYMAGRIPGAKLEIVENAGHLMLCDDAKHLARRIRRFIGPEEVARPLAKVVAVARQAHH
jgi:pimeloyl-ACP methyl ester carboxylesterase